MLKYTVQQKVHLNLLDFLWIVLPDKCDCVIEKDSYSWTMV